MFLGFCRNHEVDPFANEVYCVMRWDSKRDIVGTNQDGKPIYQGGNKMVIQMGIGGLRGLAARKHKDYGSTDEPVWVFENRKTPAGRRVPEQVTVAVWKKGAERPTRATIFWDEFAPKAVMKPDEAWKHEFWNNSPANQLAKCCEAQALRKAYPDLNNIYIKEEFARTEGDFTPEGRQIVQQDGTAPSGKPITYDAQQRTTLDENAPHGHSTGTAKALQAESQLAKVEEEDRKLREARQAAQKPPAPQPEASKPPIDVKPSPASSASPLPRLEAETVGPDRFRVMGDIQDVYPMIEKYCKCVDGFWYCDLTGLQTIQKVQRDGVVKFSLDVTPAASSAGNKDKPATQTKPAGRRAAGPPVPPELVRGNIVRVTSGMTSKNQPTRQVKIGNAWHSCYVNTIFEYLDKGIGREIEFYIDKNKAIVGLKRIHKTEFQADGRTPEPPPLSVNREPGTPELFK